MYLSFYQLNQKPFQITPDSHFLWLGERHKEALAAFKYGVLYDKSFMLLTGPVGTGKTMLTHALTQNLIDDAVVGMMVDPQLSLIEFYKQLALSFGITDTIANKSDFLQYFTAFLKDTHAHGKKVLLVVDESQRFDAGLLEEVRLLSNIELENQKLLTVFLVGSPELLAVVKANEALHQRITISYALKRLTQKETDTYLHHRLNAAGRQEKLISWGAAQALFERSKGTPRVLNILADHALLTGFLDSSERLDAAVVYKSFENTALMQHIGTDVETSVDPEAEASLPPVINTKPEVGAVVAEVVSNTQQNGNTNELASSTSSSEPSSNLSGVNAQVEIEKLEQQLQAARKQTSLQALFSAVVFTALAGLLAYVLI